MLRLITLLAISLFSISNTKPVNWDKLRWGLDPARFQLLYPTAKVDLPHATVEVGQFRRNAPLLGLVQPNSRLKFYFNYDRGYKLREFTFLTPLSFSVVVARLQKIYGKQLVGDNTEAACFDAEGKRKFEDPSGVGHVIAICEGYAIFADWKHGNVIRVGEGGHPDEFTQNFGSGEYEIIQIQNIAECDEC
jgi:hypothetical protein